MAGDEGRALLSCAGVRLPVLYTRLVSRRLQRFGRRLSGTFVAPVEACMSVATQSGVDCTLVHFEVAITCNCINSASLSPVMVLLPAQAHDYCHPP